jgi:hypothetical protein
MGSPVPDRLYGQRGQGSTIGIVLVFGMVIAGTVVVVAFGAGAISDTEDTLSVQRAEKAMTQFDSKAALVALGDTDVQQVSFGQIDQDPLEVQNGSGWMLVTIENQTTGAVEPKINQSLGAITYDGNGDTIAYQGGGVWKRSENESVMISPPEFHFRNGTLTLPIVNVSGASTLDGRASIRHAETITKFPNKSLDSVDGANPLTNHLVKVTVKSKYYQGWGQYFETRTDGEVEYDHDRNIVNLTLVSPVKKARVTEASTSLAPGKTFELLGSAKVACGATVYTNSYNSSESGDYCAQTHGDMGDIVYGGDVDISTGSGSSNIRGDVVSGDNVTVGPGNGKPDVYGHINYTDECIPDGGGVCSDAIISGSGGTVNEISGISSMNQINFFVDKKLEDVKSNNDNGVNITGSNRLDFGAVGDSETVRLRAGQYYLERIEIDDDDELILDTTSGNVEVVVEGDVQLEGGGSEGATISVEGPGNADMYVVGTDSLDPYSTGDEKDFFMEENSEIDIPGDNATRFRVYGKDNFTAAIGGGTNNLATFVGTIFAPPGKTGDGRVDINGGEVYGGLVTGTTTIDDGSIHFDEALLHTDTLADNAKIIKITYLHISVNRIYVD